MTLAHRFTLASEEGFDLAGATRWRARDDRLRREVTVYTLTTEVGAEVASSVARISTVRDPRLARIVSAGVDTVDDETVQYVVIDRPRGTSLAEVLSTTDLPPRLAGAIVGSIARALVPLSSRNLHHGAIRSAAVFVSESGVPVLSGLAIDCVLRTAAGEADLCTESGDASSLVGLYLECLTGRPRADLSSSDIPDGLDDAVRKLCIAVVDESRDLRLRDVVDAFPPDHGALRGFSGAVRGLPLRPDVAQEVMRETLGRPASDLVSDAALAKAKQAADVSLAASHAAPTLLPDVRGEHLEAITAVLPVLVPESTHEEALTAPVFGPAPDMLEERDLYDDLQAYDAMVDEQNAKPSRSLWEAIVEWPHRRWPDAPLLTALYESAHSRAERPGGIRTRLLLLLLGVVAVVAAWSIAMGMLESPFSTDMDRHNPPQQSYPAYTYGPTASPSPAEG